MPSTYPVNIELKIGFTSIREYLSERCFSPMGIKEVEKMTFSSSYPHICRLLRQTSEMKKMYESGADLPEVSFNELDKWLPSLKVASTYATTEEFGKLRLSLLSFSNVRQYFLKKSGETEDTAYIYPSLAELFSGLEIYPELLKEIDHIIDKSGEIKNSASPDLAEVREKLFSMQGSIAKAIQRIFSSAVKEGIADNETAPTFRNGRMVIPLPAANKRRLQGIVHDESASGKTIFIEPAETVELGNRIKELKLEEQRIIVRILTDLTDHIRPHIDSILTCNTLLGKMDFIMAKAKFAIESGGELPNISKNPEIDWYGAVHPVLYFNLKNQGRQVVPLNIRLEGRKRILLISGPNAGGKSVALKTVGLIQYMCQCGVLPTLYSNSHIGIFNKIFIDIGDEQSIENDLSTYSSHLKNMRYFLLHSDKRTLVLIDEIGSGTEPNIGSSLAKAILLEMAKSRCFGVITTHYHNLKQLAEEAENFINGAMLYDRQKLQPTFQLSIGNPGSSFALEIAGKIGLPSDVIEAAKKEVGEDYVESDRFLMEIARDRKYWQSKRTSIKEKEARLEVLEEKYEKLISDINRQRKEILRKAQEEASQLLSGANRKIENTISEIRQIEAERERTKQIRKSLEDFSKEVQSDKMVENPLSIQSSVKLPKNKKDRKKRPATDTNDVSVYTPTNKPLEKGDFVKMKDSGAIGQILSISSKEAEVAFGNLRTKIKLNKLVPAPKPKNSTETTYNIINASTSDESRKRQLNFRDEIDIRGMRADEALDNVTRYIDDAIQFGMKKVRILHGTGHGILRQLVRQQLGATPGILSFEDEDVRLGGAGITVVTLK